MNADMLLSILFLLVDIIIVWTAILRLLYDTQQGAYHKDSYLRTEAESSLQNVVLYKNRMMNNIQKVTHFLFSAVPNDTVSLTKTSTFIAESSGY
jgi:hypothetical protein